VEAPRFDGPVEHDVLGGQPGPGEHVLLRELALAQLRSAFRDQNTVDEGEGVAVAVVVVFFIPSQKQEGKLSLFACLCKSQGLTPLPSWSGLKESSCLSLPSAGMTGAVTMSAPEKRSSEICSDSGG
jgi:hypothetical protein